MIPIVAALAGAILGALNARRRKGKTADILQYAAVYAIIFGIAGLFASILVVRMS